jgi:hypothetical protein
MTSLISTLVDDESTQLRKPTSATRLQKQKWQEENTIICESKELAVKEVEQESIWSLRVTKESNKGRKMYYRCNLAAYRAKQFSAGLYILLHNHDLKAYSWSSNLHEIHRRACFSQKRSDRY